MMLERRTASTSTHEPPRGVGDHPDRSTGQLGHGRALGAPLHFQLSPSQAVCLSRPRAARGRAGVISGSVEEGWFDERS